MRNFRFEVPQNTVERSKNAGVVLTSQAAMIITSQISLLTIIKLVIVINNYFCNWIKFKHQAVFLILCSGNHIQTTVVIEIAECCVHAVSDGGKPANLFVHEGQNRIKENI